jgi:hypothetical protein
MPRGREIDRELRRKYRKKERRMEAKRKAMAIQAPAPPAPGGGTARQAGGPTGKGKK